MQIARRTVNKAVQRVSRQCPVNTPVSHESAVPLKARRHHSHTAMPRLPRHRLFSPGPMLSLCALREQSRRAFFNILLCGAPPTFGQDL